jgi:hypothetical protein
MCFSRSGVFTGNLDVFVVLPKILRNLAALPEGGNDSDARQLLRSLVFMKSLLEKHFGEVLEVGSAGEFVRYAFFLAFVDLLKKSLRDRVFRSEHQIVHAMRGKWLSHVDLARTHMPIEFSCDVDECDRNHPILRLALRYCRDMLALCESRAIRRSLLEWDALLSSFVECPKDVLFAYDAAKRLAMSDRRFSRWIPWLRALDLVAIRCRGARGLLSSGMGIDFEFQTWRFFEQAVYEIVVGSRLGTVRRQIVAEKILGGAFWESDQEEDFAEERVARMGSRPDLLLQLDGNRSLLLECKYKFLRRSGDARLELGTSDRNQLLAFLLSRNEDLMFNTNAMMVIYPLDEDDDGIKVQTLTFAATTSQNGRSAGVIWTNSKPPSHDAVRIFFVGIRVLRCLELLDTGVVTKGSDLDQFFTLLGTLAPERGSVRSA